ncbi:hypothetical protein QBC42DRAFT_330110 [Cladorrhinum samala]|uniref:Transmembrane protein n=1 Tax=Cladorrhinum samala TaxID=585594 RepID=A0AAV9HNH5_9PEZI|nr:hypothetical protein QBC42DRAFT_330110 [Cladorrhinum samala]
MSSIPRLPDELTVAHVAGIIAASMVVIRLLCPAVITYIMAGQLKDTETASTWTLASASLVSSIWPTLLRTDSARSGGGVRTTIMVACKAIPLLGLMCAIAGVVTPLGLGEEPTALAPRTATFEYVKDDSVYRLGTSPRGKHPLSRLCNGEHLGGSAVVGPCPYSNTEVVYVDNPDRSGFRVELPNGYNTSVPQEPREIFSSGISGSTVSSFFDIEWRQVTRQTSPSFNITELAVGMFRPLDTLTLQDQYRLVEGLIIDAKAGGIGFRNHTVPVALGRGATWEEDILFIEPSTACVNTNLTLDFEMISKSDKISNTVGDLVLTDRGGFSQLNTTLPTLESVDGQTDPDLQQRAYTAAWLNNAVTMLYLNVTNEKNKPVKGMKSFSYLDSAPGKTFPMPVAAYSRERYEGLRLSTEFGNYLRLGAEAPSLSRGALNYSNPFNISKADFTDIPSICAGTTYRDRANISNIYVACGLLRGAPERVDGGDPMLFEKGSKWSSPLYTCASSLRATIKTVHFSVNGTGIAGLNVLRVAPKTYAADGSDAPLWGLEDWGLRLDQFSPIWGLVSPEMAKKPNVTSVRKPHFNLIGTSIEAGLPSLLNLEDTQSDNLAGASFAQTVMNTVFKVVAEASDADTWGVWPTDLKGLGNLSMFRRWQALSQDSALVPQIINLMWTNIAASAVVGTRGVLGEVNSGINPAGPIPVRPIGNRITYDVRYGIPAALLLSWLGVIVVAAVCCSTCCGGGRTGFAELRRRIQQVSVGRVFTTFLHPEESTLTMSAKQWAQENGKRPIMVDAFASNASKLYTGSATLAIRAVEFLNRRAI